MKVVFSKLSDYDIQDAVSFYESRQAGLGDVFLSKLFAKADLIVYNPNAYTIRYDSVRTAKIDRFPFMIHFTYSIEKILIAGIIHTSRDPKNWKRI
jgi:plasmid stabilization system protein ParE